MGTILATVCAVFLSGNFTESLEAGGDGKVGRIHFGIGCAEKDGHLASQLQSLPEPAAALPLGSKCCPGHCPLQPLLLTEVLSECSSLLITVAATRRPLGS